MNYTIKIVAVSILSIGLLMGCSNQPEYGKLGIVVPTGDGRVTDETPYVVTGVYEHTPAHVAGIRPDDIIVQIDEVPLDGKRYGDIYQELLLGKPGEPVTLVVMREDSRIVFEVVRGAFEVEQ